MVGIRSLVLTWWRRTLWPTSFWASHALSGSGAMSNALYLILIRLGVPADQDPVSFPCGTPPDRLEEPQTDKRRLLWGARWDLSRTSRGTPELSYSLVHSSPGLSNAWSAQFGASSQNLLRAPGPPPPQRIVARLLTLPAVSNAENVEREFEKCAALHENPSCPTPETPPSPTPEKSLTITPTPRIF